MTKGPEQRAEQSITPDQGPSIPPETGRGSERIWNKHAFFWGTLISSGIIGDLLGYIIKPALGIPQELGFSYQTGATAVGMIIGINIALILMKKGLVRLQ